MRRSERGRTHVGFQSVTNELVLGLVQCIAKLTVDVSAYRNVGNGARGEVDSQGW